MPWLGEFGSSVVSMCVAFGCWWQDFARGTRIVCLKQEDLNANRLQYFC